MAYIEIPFNYWSKQRLKQGRKTATSRTKAYGKPGDVFEVEGVRYGLTLVQKLSFQEVVGNHYAEEGAKTEEEFLQVWAQIHPRWDKTKSVYFHRFIELEGTNKNV